MKLKKNGILRSGSIFVSTCLTCQIRLKLKVMNPEQRETQRKSITVLELDIVEFLFL